MAAPDAQRRHQHRVWETIAESFDRSRRRTWPHVAGFLEGLPAGSRVLDLMAGNGRHTGVALRAGHRVVAVDWSRPLVRTVAERYPDAEAVAADATALPFSDGVFDACIYVAGLHGIPTPAGRAASLRELHRVVAVGGQAQVTVWSREAPRFRDEGRPGRPLEVELPWRSDGHDEARYYHLYTRDALVAEAKDAGLEVTDARGVDVLGRGVDNEVVTLRRTGP